MPNPVNFTPSIAQLRDIHLPEPVPFWPLPIGWYIATALLLALIWLAWRHYIHRRTKRHALRLLALYEQEYAEKGDATLTAAKISDLLRRVALVYFPREQVAGLHNNAWIEFLNATGKQNSFDTVRDLLLSLPYQQKAHPANNLAPLFPLVKTWIKQRGKPCLN